MDDKGFQLEVILDKFELVSELGSAIGGVGGRNDGPTAEGGPCGEREVDGIGREDGDGLVILQIELGLQCTGEGLGLLLGLLKGRLLAAAARIDEERRALGLGPVLVAVLCDEGPDVEVVGDCLCAV
jgi:hypothetical protein